jgi:hypothetical protein
VSGDSRGIPIELWVDPANATILGESEGAVQTKETVHAVLDRLPDECSLEDVIYHLYVVQAVNEGRAEVQAGRTLSHEQVAQELRHKWLAGSET